jgi:hypothetical protein
MYKVFYFILFFIDKPAGTTNLVNVLTDIDDVTFYKLSFNTSYTYMHLVCCKCPDTLIIISETKYCILP